MEFNINAAPMKSGNIGKFSFEYIIQVGTVSVGLIANYRFVCFILSIDGCLLWSFIYSFTRNIGRLVVQRRCYNNDGTQFCSNGYKIYL